jgi:hypothetical protein
MTLHCHKCRLSASDSLRQLSWSDPCIHSRARRAETENAVWSVPWKIEVRTRAFLDDTLSGTLVERELIHWSQVGRGQGVHEQPGPSRTALSRRLARENDDSETQLRPATGSLSSPCPREDSNLHAQRAQALNLPCIPIPPRGQLQLDYSVDAGTCQLATRHDAVRIGDRWQ